MRKFYLLFTSFLFLISLSVWAQERTVTGTVTAAEDGSVIPGANVVLKGTTNGVPTDANGNFSIQVPGPEAVLTFSFIGRVSRDAAVGDQSSINIVLSNSSKELDEVVVTANAIERRKRELGYTTTEFNNQDVTQGRDRSVLNSMQGKVAGVNITSGSGSPGASTKVLIRGPRSLTNSNDPLFVVDGIPIDNGAYGSGISGATGTDQTDNLNNQVDPGNRANDVNPEDIESITVLKGPAAAALYGSRASNGAIIITTKSGKGAANRNRKAEVNYTASYSFETPLRIPEFQNTYGQGGNFQPDYRENWSWGPKFDGVVRPWGKEIEGRRKVKPYVALPDNVKEFFNVGKTFQQNVSLGGGNEKSNYYTSFGMLDQSGVVPGTEFKRHNFKVNGGTNLTNKIYTSASIGYTKSRSDLALGGQQNSPLDQLIQQPRDISLLELRDLSDPFNTLSGYYSPYTQNPYYFLANDNYRTDVDRLLGNVQFGYRPVEWLDILYRIGTDVYSDRREQITSKRVVDGENAQFDTPFPGFYGITDINVQETNSDLMITYNRALSERFHLRVLVGNNVRSRRLSQVSTSINGLVIPNFYNFDNANGVPVANNYQEQFRTYGIYGDATLSYNDYLFLGLTARNDWSSSLRQGNNSFFYPAVNASFLFSEAFKLPANIVSMGKLRGNFAQVGNSAPAYQLASIYGKADIDDGFANTNLTFPFNGVPGFSLGDRIGNPDLRPEYTQSFEVGLDVNMFNNRFGFEVSYYNNLSKDLILPVPIAPSSGFTSQSINAGSLTNKGIEALVRITPVKVGAFEWNVAVNYTKNVNKVQELFGDTKQLQIGTSLSSATLQAVLGQPFGSFLVNDELKDPQGRVVVDESGLPILDPQARLVGNIQPDWLGGITNTFSFKGIYLSATFDTRQGGYLYSRTKDLQEFVGTSPNTLQNDRQPFIVPNSVIQNDDGSFSPNTDRPVSAQAYWTDQTVTSRNLIPATFVKLREVALSYALPKALIDRTPFGNIVVGISGRNLWLKTPKSNTFVDPEVSSLGNGNTQGYDYTTVPSVKSYGGNIRITF